MGATGPGCASRQASSSAKRRAALRSRLRWIVKTEPAKLQVIRASQRSGGNGRSWFAGRQRPRPDHLLQRSAKLLDRECHQGLSPRPVGSLSTALFGVVLCESRDRCQRQLESGSSSEPGRRFFLGPLKTVDHFLRHGILRLDLFKDAVLIFQVGLHLSRVLQNEGDGALNFRQRSNRRVSLEDRFR
jgi:hypothetical protein